MRLGFMGQLRSGKTTASDYVRNNVPFTYALQLATPIYQAAKALYAQHDIPWQKNRRLLEGLGEMFNSDPKGDYLLRSFLDQLKLCPENMCNVVCDDVRTIEQANILQFHGFKLIKIVSDEEIRRSRCKPGEFATGHYSDIELLNYAADATISNNDTVEQFYMQLSELIERFKGGNNG